MLKRFEVSVKILISIDEEMEDIADIANQYAEMALRYKSIGAEKVLEVSTKEFDRQLVASQ